MKKQIAMCAACLGMLSFFLYVSFLYVSHDTPKTLNGTVVFSQDIFINGIRMKEDWYSEYEYQVSLYLTTSGKMVIRVVSTEEKDHILQEIPVSLPGDVVEISGFLSSRGEDSGGGAVLVREVPADIDAAGVTATLEEIAGELRQGRSPAERREALLHTMACKAAIKGGWKTSPEELRALVEKVQSGEVRYCPHGRPVAVKITKHELEKLFKRA